MEKQVTRHYAYVLEPGKTTDVVNGDKRPFVAMHSGTASHAIPEGSDWLADVIKQEAFENTPEGCPVIVVQKTVSYQVVEYVNAMKEGKQKKRKADAESDAKSEQIKKQKRSIVPKKNYLVTVDGYEGTFLVSQVQQEVRVKLFRTEYPYATIFKNVEHIKSIVKHARIPKKGDTVRFYRSQGSQSNFGVGVVKEECLGHVYLQLKGGKRGWCLSHNSSYYILDEVVAGSKNL